MYYKRRLVLPFWENLGNCCVDFKPKRRFILSPNKYKERTLEYGFCPKCNVFVVSLKTKDFDGHISTVTAKRKKAINLYNALKPDIITGYRKNIRQGNRSNMAFIFGLNIQKGETISQYAVDFNGEKKLIKTLKVVTGS